MYLINQHINWGRITKPVIIVVSIRRIIEAIIMIKLYEDNKDGDIDGYCSNADRY